MHAQVKRLCVLAGLIMSIAVSVYSGLLYHHGLEPQDGILWAYGVVFFVFVVTWLLADMRTLGRSVPSFDAFWLVWAILLVHLPYHLYSTRRWRGLLLLAGIVALYLLPWLVAIGVLLVS
jgi:hypothetical protein